jgi:arabinogalactan endo-1,4-beta-galactosidase
MSNKLLIRLSRALIILALIGGTVLLGASGGHGKKKIGKMLGADISFLPQLESRGIKFSDNGVQKDALQILKDHRFNYIRLRIFNDPAADSGYSPGKGFCDLEHTEAMAKRVKAAGMKFLLDFHYSDTWADPGKQFKPAAWKGYSFEQLTQAVREYTRTVLTALKEQGTLPDMVQVGNEINHGILWPDGNTKNLDTLAAFLKAGIAGVNDVDPSINIMLHIACGGQNDQSRYFLDNMLARHVDFDVVGESYYPQWHGTLDQLKSNLTDLATRYKQDVVVAEYTEHKKEVNDIEFNLPDNKGKGTFIWEPLSTWEFFVDKDGKTNDLINIYQEVAKKYDIK